MSARLATALAARLGVLAALATSSGILLAQEAPGQTDVDSKAPTIVETHVDTIVEARVVSTEESTSGQPAGGTAPDSVAKPVLFGPPVPRTIR